jgi:hypothetical protein
VWPLPASGLSQNAGASLWTAASCPQPRPRNVADAPGPSGEANGVRTVWYRATGIATVVGMPVDLETTELLFTSLLVQAGRAMNVAAAAGGAHARSAAFRRSFLRSFGWRIGERLIAARSNATTEAAETAGVDLLPVLRSRQRAVDEVYEELFPSATSRRSRAFDAAGWAAGHRAADSADLSSRRGRLPQ